MVRNDIVETISYELASREAENWFLAKLGCESLRQLCNFPTCKNVHCLHEYILGFTTVLVGIYSRTTWNQFRNVVNSRMRHFAGFWQNEEFLVLAQM